ncbi:RNI-like protein [Ramaria rubella]|nr:RNI-like protein [Ramaria rubella]
MSRNNVRGPTSALTEFLREQGITARAVVHTSPQRRGRPVEDDRNAQAGPSNADADTRDVGGDFNDGEGGTNGGGTPRKGKKSGYGSDDLDDTNDEGDKPAAKRRKLSKAALAKEKAKAKAKAKKKKGGDDDDDFEDSEEDQYTALSKGGFTRTGKGNVLPPAGSFENCATCGKKFTVTRYTIAANPGPGFLCHSCAKASGTDPFKKPATPRKRKDPAEKRKVVSFEETEKVKTLATMCIDVIGKHIEDVEALGDIGTVNMDEIARVIAKNRSLTPQNSQLFYDVKNTSLTLYDVTNLHPDSFCALGSLNPNLESLRLDFCGRMTNEALLHWSAHMPSLARVELLGPFLVRVPGWISFFERMGPRLRGFLITQSPRFDLECVETLVKYSPTLKELRLSEIGKLSDEFIPHLATLSHLTYLDLSKPSHSLSDDAVQELLQAVGTNLTHLSLTGNEALTDATLLDGILPHVTNLISMSLSNVPLVTDQGFSEFFNSWSENPPLEYLDLSRNHLPSSAALAATLAHSAKGLSELSINGWREASTESLLELGSKASNLTKIDLGWCRGVDDFVIKGLLDGCGKLREIKCYGCNRVTENCPRKSSVKIFGVESHAMA